MNLDECFLIGEIKAIKGDAFVLLNSFSDFPERFLEIDEVIINTFGVFKELIVEEASVEENKIYLKFERFDDPERMDFLRGKKIYVRPDEAVLLEEGTWFIHDLIGSKVLRNNEIIGTVKDVLVLSANDVYEITLNDGEELLVPAVDDYVDNFDSEKRILFLKSGDDSFYENEN